MATSTKDALARRSRHDDAVVQAEARRLARALRPYGVLHRDALERVAGAMRWRDGWFDTALNAAVESGKIEKMPGGFVRDPGLPA
jgi:hypothetical protein